MAITIRNKRTEAMIRELGRQRGEGPSAVIRQLAEQELSEGPGGVSREEHERRRRVFEELRRQFPPPEPKVPWSEIEAEMQAIYDYLDED